MATADPNALSTTCKKRRLAVLALPAGAAVALSALSLAAPGCGLTADYSGLQGGSPRTYCSALSPQPAFCADFDEKPLPFPWAYVSTMGGQLALDSTESVSAPNSVAVQDVAGAPLLDLALRTPFPRFPPPPSTIDFAFSFQPVGVNSPTDGPRLVIAAIDFLESSIPAPDGGPDSGPPPNRYSLQLTLVKSGDMLNLALEEETSVPGACLPYMPHPLPGALTAGTWTDVRVTVNRSGPMTATAAVWFGPNQELMDTPLCMSITPSQGQIGIGSIYKSVPASVWKNRYDNVTLDVAPAP